MDWFHVMTMCLALNVYQEARWEPFEGQVAVAQVVLNRAKAHHRDICEVVFRRKQFSWTTNALDARGKLLPKWQPREGDPHWDECMLIAQGVLANQFPDYAHGARFYHADYVHPKWAKRMKVVARIGHHIFYRRVHHAHS